MSLTTATTRTGETLPAFIHDGVEYRLGRVVPHRLVKVGRPWAESGNPVIPFASIPDFDYWPNIAPNTPLPTLDQNGNGSCVGHGCTQALMMARLWTGQAYVPLSADGLYSHINGGRDQGAAPSDGVNWICSKGVETIADVPDKYILERDIPAAALQTALRFRAAQNDVYQLDGSSGSIYDEMATAMWLRFAVILTINVGNNFGPDSSGIVGFAGGTANHCVCGGAAKKGANLRFKNSWTDTWGVEHGSAWFTRKHIDNQVQGDHWAIKTTLVDPEDPNQPPV